MSRLVRLLALFVCLLPLSAVAGKNTPPSVNLTAPASGATFHAPATVPLSASAADANGTVTKVDFYRGGTTLIGTATAAPYAITWTNALAGSYTLTAKATDNQGATATSTAVTITVTPNTPPTVALTAPAPGTRYTAPATITLAAVASDTDGAVAKVDFYQGSTFIGSSTTAPYSVNWTNVSAGSYTISARVTDNLGATATSGSVGIAVGPANLPPLVALTAPAACGTFDTSTGVSLNAEAVDPDGRIVQVDYYAGTTLLGSVPNPKPYTDTGLSYAFSWSGMAAGTYAVTAVATDNAGAVTTSAPMTLTLAAPNQPPSAVLTAPQSGAVFGASAPITLIANAWDSDGSISKVEFRTSSYYLIGVASVPPYSIVWSGTKTPGQYMLIAYATDNRGAVSASPGVPISIAANTPPSVNLTSPALGSIYSAPATIALAATAADSDGTVARMDFYQSGNLVGSATAAPYTFTWSNVAAGSYTLTARATDNLGAETTSAPVTVTVNANAPPTVSLTGPAAGSTYIAPAAIALAATAADANGTVAKVDFYQGATLVGTATAAPYAFTWTNIVAGNYTFTARATDNLGATTTSASISVTVNPNLPPTVNLTAPVAGSSSFAPASVALAATAADNDGGVAKVDFYQGTTLIGTATAAPYSFNWTNVPAGSYALTAVATDNLGAATVSTPVNIMVSAPALTMVGPQDGAAISGTSVMVRGTFNATPNSGITVNGVVAALGTANDFYALVPLTAGSNAITATLTTPGNQTSSQTVTVSADGVTPAIPITADKLEGIAALTANFTINGTAPLQATFMISGGSTTLAQSGTNTFAVTYPGPGTYPTSITATDGQGHSATQDFVVVVHDLAQMDQMLKSLWSGMSNALVAGNKATALNYLSTPAQAKYGPVFDVLLPNMAQIVGSFSPPRTGSISTEIGEYAINRTIDGVNQVFFLYFLRGSDGVWRLDSM